MQAPLESPPPHMAPGWHAAPGAQFCVDPASSPGSTPPSGFVLLHGLHVYVPVEPHEHWMQAPLASPRAHVVELLPPSSRGGVPPSAVGPVVPASRPPPPDVDVEDDMGSVPTGKQ